jgi:hypothetical protein
MAGELSGLTERAEDYRALAEELRTLVSSLNSAAAREELHGLVEYFETLAHREDAFQFYETSLGWWRQRLHEVCRQLEKLCERIRQG